MEYLNLRDNQLVEYSFLTSIVPKLTKLDELNLANNKINSNDLLQIWMVLFNNYRLKELTFSRWACAFDIRGIIAVEQETTVNKTIQQYGLDEMASGATLDLRNFQFDHIEPVIKYLRLKEGIKNLNLSGSNLDSIGLRKLAVYLFDGSVKLNALDLSNN